VPEPPPDEPVPSARGTRAKRHPTLRRDLDACTGDGMTYSFMVGIGETYVAAFAVALGFLGTTSGLIASAPPIVGGIAQLVAPRGIRLFGGSPQRWVMGCATVQALSLVALLTGALAGAMPAWLVFLCASVYWTGALAAASVWNTWVGEIFPARLRARYFGQRNRWCQLATLAGLLLGGALIGMAERSGHVLVGFAACFGLAALARLASLVYLRQQGDPSTPHVEHRRVPFAEVIGRRSEGASLIVSMVILQFAVHIGQPFFNPFMLKALAYDPWTYTTAIAAAFVARSAMLPLAGRLIDRHGARRVLMPSAIGVSLLATVWMVSGSPWWIIPTQLLAGAVWATYELAVFLLLLEMLPTVERTSVMAWYYLLNSAAMAMGAVVGAFLLFGEETWVGYTTVFAASTLLRLAAVTRFVGLKTDSHRSGDLRLDPVAVRASSGSISVPEEA
jgi:MFS family permease